MRHPLHSICPYFAMFPEKFVEEQLLAFTRPGDLVFDPFSGRGTTVFESALMGRRAIGSDINPVAACISKAKCAAPDAGKVHARISSLRRAHSRSRAKRVAPNGFFEACFHPDTLDALLFLRRKLDWQNDEVDCFIAAVTLGVLHGESHRTKLCLSNRMPRTISTKPDYSVRWWASRGLVAPPRDVFAVLDEATEFRLRLGAPRDMAEVRHGDSRQAGKLFAEHRNAVSLVVTSPPYLDTTDYSEDQWLRLWFLGGSDRPLHRLNRDDRHTNLEDYWSFLKEIWQGMNSLLASRATVVVRIGGTKVPKEVLLEGLKSGLREALPGFKVRTLHQGVSSVIAKRQTNAFRPGTSALRMEHDFVFRLS